MPTLLKPQAAYRLAVLAGACLALSLGACSETKLAVNTAKEVAPTQSKIGGYKIGKPYQIDGVWYYPQEDFNYVEEGVSSWYGPSFHGKSTANGETYDMMDLTAAHRTLPMPSVVRVTNMENGRSLVVRVNDRGPFARNRIIDVSKRAAQLLGFHEQGTTRVRVEILADESRALKAQAIAASGDMPAVTAAPRGSISSESLDSPPSSGGSSNSSGGGAVTTASLSSPPPSSSSSSYSGGASTSTAGSSASRGAASYTPTTTGTSYVQAGAFSDKYNAERLKKELKNLGAATISTVQVNGRELYRVRLGPLSSTSEAERLLSAVQARGVSGAKVVND
ncbi:septal ring lytic transglycosylase RlpA family protein [Insolitispirillum peregrinum]|uniref:septal ring lytic transglycosylase RlpA family protein n=1 Tax=Insolitispirillum peregrinum TaxID=80876 RepID=UPI0036133B0E